MCTTSAQRLRRLRLRRLAFVQHCTNVIQMFCVCWDNTIRSVHVSTLIQSKGWMETPLTLSANGDEHLSRKITETPPQEVLSAGPTSVTLVEYYSSVGPALRFFWLVGGFAPCDAATVRVSKINKKYIEYESISFDRLRFFARERRCELNMSDVNNENASVTFSIAGHKSNKDRVQKNIFELSLRLRKQRA